MMQTKLSIELNSPMRNISTIIINIKSIMGVLTERGYSIGPTKGIRRIITQLKSLRSALENSYATVQLPKTTSDFLDLLDKATRIAQEAKKLRDLLNNKDLCFYDKATDAKIRALEPALYFHLNDIFLYAAVDC